MRKYEETDKYTMIDYSGEVIIGDRVWIFVLPSVAKVGKGAVIGAGAVVTHDVPPYAVVAGNPARIMKEDINKEWV